MGSCWDCVFTFCVCLLCVCLRNAGVPSPPLLPAHGESEVHCLAAKCVDGEVIWGIFFALSQLPQTTMRQQVINFCHFLEL